MACSSDISGTGLSDARGCGTCQGRCHTPEAVEGWVIAIHGEFIALFEKTEKRLMLVPQGEKGVFHSVQDIIERIGRETANHILLVGRAADITSLKGLMPDRVKFTISENHQDLLPEYFTTQKNVVSLVKWLEQQFWPPIGKPNFSVSARSTV